MEKQGSYSDNPLPPAGSFSTTIHTAHPAQMHDLGCPSVVLELIEASTYRSTVLGRCKWPMGSADIDGR